MCSHRAQGSDVFLCVRCAGDVWWLNQGDAFGQGLAYINNAGNAILKVDNTHNVAFNQKRNSVSVIAVLVWMTIDLGA